MEKGDWATNRVVQFIAAHSGRSPESIRLDESLIAFDIDSLEDIEFIMELEGEVGIEIPDPVMPLVTVGDLVALVRSARRS